MMNDPYNPSDEPHLSIRTDLWPTMTISELTNQQELLLNRASALGSIMGSSPNQTYRDLYATLQLALNDLSNLIEYRMSNKTQQG